MAQMFSVTPILRERRSSQSGNFVMTAAWQTIYASTALFAYRFSQGMIDLTNMAAGDIINFRISKRLDPLGGYIVHDQKPFFGLQPDERKQFKIGSLLDVHGIIIEAQQTQGGLRTLYCEFMEAFR